MGIRYVPRISLSEGAYDQPETEYDYDMRSIGDGWRDQLEEKYGPQFKLHLDQIKNRPDDKFRYVRDAPQGDAPSLSGGYSAVDDFAQTGSDGLKRALAGNQQFQPQMDVSGYRPSMAINTRPSSPQFSVPKPTLPPPDARPDAEPQGNIVDRVQAILNEGKGRSLRERQQAYLDSEYGNEGFKNILRNELSRGENVPAWQQQDPIANGWKWDVEKLKQIYNMDDAEANEFMQRKFHPDHHKNLERLGILYNPNAQAQASPAPQEYSGGGQYAGGEQYSAPQQGYQLTYPTAEEAFAPNGFGQEVSFDNVPPQGHTYRDAVQQGHVQDEGTLHRGYDQQSGLNKPIGQSIREFLSGFDSNRPILG